MLADLSQDVDVRQKSASAWAVSVCVFTESWKVLAGVVCLRPSSVFKLTSLKCP